MITIAAPEGIGEIGPQTDLAADILAGCDSLGGLADGDIVVVTSKIISKHEAMTAPATERQQVIDAETVRTVARRRSMAIVETHHGLTQAAAGVDNSNVAPDTVLLLPTDPDASAEKLRRGLVRLSGRSVGVIISDTAGRAWRLGQTDHAIGSAGVLVIDSYDGRHDSYGNELHVTMIAIADELAGAADLVKRKLAGRPVGLIRGLGEFVLDLDDGPAGGPTGEQRGGEHEPGPGARDLLRPGSDDLFRMGARESVIHAVLEALGVPERYEAAVRVEEADELVTTVTAGLDLDPGERALAVRMLSRLT